MAALAPVDPEVKLPPSIARAAAQAAELHKQAYGDQTDPDPHPALEPTPQPETPPATPQPEPEPAPAPVEAAPEPAPAPPEPAPASLGTAEQEHHRYLSMKGRVDQAQLTIGQMQEQMSQLGDELVRTQQALRQQGQPQQPPPPATPLVTEADIQTYGLELIDTIQRAARQAVMPDLQSIDQRTRQVNQQVVKDRQQGVYNALGTELPNWQEINNSPRFKQWCSLRDVYSGTVRRQMLQAAFQAADAPRVVAFFRGFLNEEHATGNAPASQPAEQGTPRVAAIPLETLAAPGRAKPATGQSNPSSADKPIFTHKQIGDFYSQSGRKAYEGREDDRKRDENAIFLAQREGRVR